ncbi:TolC family protein [Ilyomonas limi]|uniref:TolC family protein n=1 Tax=Ilyomonas limi TaxID=2575867 RepID=A0A4U3KUM5_9BACT|nr:TolC family protein [Ilyomonas limi]TKK65234.1 TolC family protein [Ilyomonas limi]
MSHKSNIFLFILFLSFYHISSAQQTVSSQETMLYNVSDVYLQKLIDTAKKNYPRLQVYDKRIENAQIEVKRAKAGWFDALSFSYLYSPNNATTIVDPNLLNGYQVGMFVNVGSMLQRPATIKKAKTDVEISKAEKAEYELNITALVKQRYYLYIQALSVLKMKAQSLIDVESTMQQVKYKYEKGEETLDAYNKDLVSYEDRIEGKMQAEGAVLIAKSNLEELLGTKLENIK